MAGFFTAVDLSQVPAPDVIETVDFEAILADMLADLQARDPSFTALLESDPAYKILQVAAYRETLLRQRINEAGRAVMLAYATGADLDNLAALLGVTRLVLDQGNPDALPPIPPTMESDADFRRRITLALEGFSTAGPRGAYLFHAISASPAVADAGVDSPAPGVVRVSVLSHDGDGTASSALLSAVTAALNAESVRPLTDTVQVQSAQIVPYQVQATLFFLSGPDSAVVMARAEAAIADHVASLRRIGRDVTLSGIYAALHQPGVQRVELAEPSTSISIGSTQAAICTSIVLTDGGIDE